MNSAAGTNVNSAPFRRKRAARSEQQVLHQLLGNCGGSSSAIAFHIVFGNDLDLMPVESVVLVEARVFSRDDSVLEMGRDLAE